MRAKISIFLVFIAISSLLAEPPNWQDWQKFPDHPEVAVRYAWEGAGTPYPKWWFQFGNQSGQDLKVEIRFACVTTEGKEQQWTNSYRVDANGTSIQDGHSCRSSERVLRATPITILKLAHAPRATD